jgi:hypothetical protein
MSIYIIDRFADRPSFKFNAPLTPEVPVVPIVRVEIGELTSRIIVVTVKQEVV